MALIHCPDCGYIFSEKSVACPKCGYIVSVNNQQNRKAKDIIIIVLLSLILISIVTLVVVLTRKTNVSSDDSYEKNQVIEDGEAHEAVSESTTEEVGIIKSSEKVDVIQWQSGDNNIFIVTDDIYISKDGNGNYGVVAKFSIAGASEEKAEIPSFSVSLYQDGKIYDGAYSHTVNIAEMDDFEEFYNMKTHDDYLYPPNNGYAGSVSVLKVAEFMPIASYDLEDEFQIRASIGFKNGTEYSDQYMEVDHLEVR